MTTTTPVSILGIPGSLRAGSYNKLLLKAAQELLPSTAQLEILDISDIPLYNQDNEGSLPRSVELLKEKVQQADAVLFATPEYNYSIPAVLKNAIDWASRPMGKNSWLRKPAAIIGASAGVLGTVRAQYHLRQVLVALDMQVANKPEVLIGAAHQRFDADGRLVDSTSRELLKSLLENLIALAEQHRR
jgi:chromate reductase